MADLKYVKVDKITGRKVVVSLKDVAPYWLYDTKTLDNTNRKVSFFSNINKSNPVDTNMLQDNQLPAGWKFHILAMRIVPDPNADANLIASVLYNSVVEFVKESYDVFKAPAFTFPAGGGVMGKPSNGLPSSEAILPMPMQMEIEGMTPFSVNLTVSPAVDFGTNTLKTKVVLDGIVYKNIVAA